MSFDDDGKALACLSVIGYYHLTPYWLNLFLDKTKNKYKNGTNFNQVLNLYCFDKELRKLLFDAISTIEIAFRTMFVNFLTCKYADPFIFSNKKYFSNLNYYQMSSEKLLKEFDASGEAFSRHFKETYQEKLPPAWIATELMTLGELSKWFSNLKLIEDKNSIGLFFDLNGIYFEAFLRSITEIRNICAHQGRLWNRILKSSVREARYEGFLNDNLNHDKTNIGQYRRIYNVIVYLLFCLEKIGSKLDLKNLFLMLVNKYNINVSDMGFPQNWRTFSAWT